MKALKRTFSFLNYTCKKEYYKVLWIVAIVDCIEIFAKAQLYYSKKGEYVPYCFHDNHIIVLLIAVLGIGFLYGGREFDGYMQMAAKRKEYLMGVLSYSILLSLGSVALNRIIILILSGLVIYILGIPGAFFSPISLVKEGVIYLLGMHLGFFIGAVFYRMRKSTFWVMSVMVGYVLLRIALGGYFLGIDMDKVKQGVWEIEVHFGVMGLVLVLVCMLGSVLLLRKAPIKVYAHDTFVMKMQNTKIYKMLGYQFIKRMIILLLVMSIWLGIDAFGAYRMYIQTNNITFVVFATPYILGIGFLLITGGLYSYYHYAVFLSIQAKRQTYLNGIILLGTIGSIMLISLVYGLAQVATAFTRGILPSDVVKDSFPLSIAGILSLWGIGLVAFALGFFVGALFYRFKMATATCVISALPLAFTISILSNFLFDNNVSTSLMLIMMFIVNSLVGGTGQIIWILLFWMMGYKLLVNAPVKQYAHDLL